MHESFFGLQKRPFLAVPTLDRYCPVASQENAFQSCARAIARAEGPSAILGGTGLGKSMVCLRIAEVFRRSYEVILLASSQICSRRALLQNLLFELRMPYRDLSEGELRLSLLDRLQPSNENPTDGLVLIVDEAQTLSVKLLEELRLITNLTRDGIPRVRLVLCGTLRLEEMLGHPQLESLNQRLACRCYLAPLNQHETICYLTHKIELCGAAIQSTFTEDSMKLIHRATDGIPRLIDQLADQSLRLAAEARQRPVSASLIESAWASLQQIPLPWSDTGTPIARSESSIEYGSLIEDHEQDFAGEALNQTPSVAYESSRSVPAARPTEPSPTEVSATDRTIASPIPSAGMGLSRAAPAAVQTTRSSETAADANDPWDDFIHPSDRRMVTGVIEDYVEDLLDSPSASPSGYPSVPSWQTAGSVPETVDYDPSPSVLPREAGTADDLFGSDFEDEVELPIDARYAERVLPASPADFQAVNELAFQYHSMPNPVPDEALKPYTELLDTLSNANLEAMTLDPRDSLEAYRPIEVIDENPAYDILEGGLARQTRSTILSFTDLQASHQPLISDDRDMLVIEDDLPAHGSELNLEPQASAAVQPYKQLFSKLRG